MACLILDIIALLILFHCPLLQEEEGFLPVNGEVDFYLDTAAAASGDTELKPAPNASNPEKEASPPSPVQGDQAAGSSGDSVPPNTLNVNPTDIITPVATAPRLVFTDTTPTDDEDLELGSGSGIPPLSGTD